MLITNLGRDEKEVESTQKWVIVVAVIVAAVIGGVAYVLWWAPSQKYAIPEDTFGTLVDAFNNYDAYSAYDTFSSRMKAEHSKAELESYLARARYFDIKVADWRVLEKSAIESMAILEIEATLFTAGKKETEADNIRFVLEDGKWLIDEWVGPSPFFIGYG